MSDSVRPSTIRLLVVEGDGGDAPRTERPGAPLPAVRLEVERADSLKSALVLLERGHFDAILLDLMLPDCSGLDTLVAIHEQAGDVPIVVLSTLNDEEMALEALRHGAQDYLVKGQADGAMLVRSVRYAIGRKRGRQRLLESEARYRRLMEEASDAIFITDFRGTFLDVNPATCELTGYSRDELLGMSIRDVVVQEEYAAVPPRFNELQAGQSVLSERMIQRKDGARLLLEVNARRIDEERIEGIARDVTERRASEERSRRLAEALERRVAERTAELEEANRKLEQEIEERQTIEDALRKSRDQLDIILQGVADGITVQDVDGRLVFANHAAARILGFASQEELLAAPGDEVLRRYDLLDEQGQPFPLSELPGRLALTGVASDEVVIGWRVRETGDTRWSIVQAAPAFDEEGGVYQAINIFREMTERKATEDVLRTRAGQQAAVASLGLHALLGGDVAELLDESVRVVASTLGVELCKVLELLPGKEELLVISGVGWQEGVVGKARVSAGRETQVGYILAVDEPVIVTDLSADPRFDGTELLYEHGVISGMSVIIHGKAGPFGVLGAHTTSRRTFTDDDIHFLQAVANVLATAIERKRVEDALRESEERFRTLADTAPVMIWMADASTAVSFFNKTWLDFTGRPMEEELGEGWVQDVHPEDAQRCMDVYLRSFKTRQGYRMEYRVRRADGEYRWVLDSGVPRYTPGGVFEGYIGSCIDITERRLAEDEIRQLNTRMQAANRELEAFSYSVSHDLRSPLRAISGYTAALAEEQGEQLGQDGNFYLERIRVNAQQMDQLINDLLSFSRLARQQLERADIDMEELANYVFGELQVINPGRDIRLEVKSAPHARGDWAMVRLVVQNLIQNAMKFTRPREVAVIEFGGSAAEGEEGRNVYYLRDNGVGFDMRYSNKLFGVFQRLHTSSEFEGTGVGLALVQRVVHRHGGQVWAESTPGEGATFYFTLPAK